MAKKLTAKKIEKYLKRGSSCPLCRSALSLEGESVEVEGNEARQEMSCFECGLIWTDIYVLARIELAETET